jgi:hypothetical protein
MHDAQKTDLSTQVFGIGRDLQHGGRAGRDAAFAASRLTNPSDFGLKAIYPPAMAPTMKSGSVPATT